MDSGSDGRCRCAPRGARDYHRRPVGAAEIAAIAAAGSVVGAQLAARYGRRLSPPALRAVIVAVGIVAIVQLVT